MPVTASVGGNAVQSDDHRRVFEECGAEIIHADNPRLIGQIAHDQVPPLFAHHHREPQMTLHGAQFLNLLDRLRQIDHFALHPRPRVEAQFVDNEDDGGKDGDQDRQVDQRRASRTQMPGIESTDLRELSEATCCRLGTGDVVHGFCIGSFLLG